MSAVAILEIASTGRLHTGSDGNPWGTTWSQKHGQADTEITIALWECGLLWLPRQRRSDGSRLWQLTNLGATAMVVGATQGPQGYIPPVGGPYD